MTYEEVQTEALYAAHDAVKRAEKDGSLAVGDTIGAATLGVLAALDVAQRAWRRE